MINFCHIAPSNYLSLIDRDNKGHLILAHLVKDGVENKSKTSKKYLRYYQNKEREHNLKIMDNSAYEMFRQGKPMLESSELIDLGKQCGTKFIVMSDYPGEHAKKTWNAAMKMADNLKINKFSTFYCPQSEVGQVDQYLKYLHQAVRSDMIDLIGLSILGVPFALGIETGIKDNENKYRTTYNLERFMSRVTILKMIKQSKEYKQNPELYKKKFHCLGMFDGPNEIILIRKYFDDLIYSWDSSAAVWAGINFTEFDMSPTGLVNGKIESEVDFHIDLRTHSHAPIMRHLIKRNVKYINKLCEENIDE